MKTTSSKRRAAARKPPAEPNVEWVDLDKVRPHPKNYRAHPDDQLEHIKTSLRRYGIYRNVVLARDGTILAGHGVIESARKLKMKKVLAIRLDVDPSDADALRVLTGDNEISKLAEINDRMLTDILKAVKDSDDGEGLKGTGYDAKMLAALAMVTRPRGEISGFNEAAEWVGMPEFGSKSEDIKITVLFRNKKDREKFVDEFKLKITTHKTEKAWTTWWPPKARDDLEAVRFEG